MVVKKAFKDFDCEILEASNGVEGLSTAAKEMPDLVLLDVTMPVMDGVEMLTRLKCDAALKAIPVIMLTAEGGRDHVLKVAKIGVRDYVVKPFRDDVLIEKVGRVINLKPRTEAPLRTKSISDPADILVVDDKSAIIEQIRDGLKHWPWRIHGAASQGEAVDFCARTPPDLVIISLSLPDETGLALFRLIRANVCTKYTPVFGLAVRTETAQMQQAQNAGLGTVITKPIDMRDLETRIAKAMNLDTSKRYYAIESETLIMRLPETCGPLILTEIDRHLKPKIAEAVDAGHVNVVIDAHLLNSLEMAVIKLLFQAMQTCRELGLKCAMVGNSKIAAECKGIEDTRHWNFYDSIEAARAPRAT